MRLSDPLSSLAEDQPRAAKFTPASPVPPIGSTAAARVLTAAHALGTGYAVGSPRLCRAMAIALWPLSVLPQTSPSPASGAGAYSPAHCPLPSVAYPTAPFPLHPAFPWHIGEGETESPASQDRRSSALPLPLLRACRDSRKGGVVLNPSLSPGLGLAGSLRSTGLTPGTHPRDVFSSRGREGLHAVVGFDPWRCPDVEPHL